MRSRESCPLWSCRTRSGCGDRATTPAGRRFWFRLNHEGGFMKAKWIFLWLPFLLASRAWAVDLVGDMSWVNTASNAADIVIERQDGPNAPWVAVINGVLSPNATTFQDMLLGASEG